MPQLTRQALLIAAIGLAGCVRLGPEFQSPREAWVEDWRSTALEQLGEPRPQADSRQWWRQFDDPVLDRLIA